MLRCGLPPLPPISSFQRDISHHLTLLAEGRAAGEGMLPHVVRHSLDEESESGEGEGGRGSGLLVDIAWPAQQVALQVQGPEMYSLASRSALGPSQFKGRLMRASGWTVVDVPFWEWDQLGANEGHKVSYLCTRLGVPCAACETNGLICGDCAAVMWKMAHF